MNFGPFENKKLLGRKLLYGSAAVACLCLPSLSSAAALAIGLFFGIVLNNPFQKETKKLTHRFLSLAVIGLGAGMDLEVVAKVGAQGFLYTFIGILFAIGCGLFLGRRLKVNANSSLLICVGTAICGGSAIASVAPVIRAKSHEISIALGIVFLLNSIALLIFPHIGHYFLMSQEQFGLWSALAIHDTSSVVGASMAYGDRALGIGTTVKLARALWIVPVTLVIGLFVSRKGEAAEQQETKRKYPWFILGFLLTAALYTWLPQVRASAHYIEMAAKRLLVLTLFFIGSNLNREILRGMGLRPVMQGILLWLISASLSLLAILQHWIEV